MSICKCVDLLKYYNKPDWKLTWNPVCTSWSTLTSSKWVSSLLRKTLSTFYTFDTGHTPYKIPFRSQNSEFSFTMLLYGYFFLDFKLVHFSEPFSKIFLNKLKTSRLFTVREGGSCSLLNTLQEVQVFVTCVNGMTDRQLCVKTLPSCNLVGG